MSKHIIDSYHGWSIKVTEEKNMCANFSFDITDPNGRTQHVTMGGDDPQRTLTRAREMIDLERSLADES